MAPYLTWCICLLVIIVRFSRGCPVVEEGQPATIECTFPENVTSVTWQDLWIGEYDPRNVSTCYFENNTCDTRRSNRYEATTSSVNGTKRTTLLLKSTEIKHTTKYACVADNGIRGQPCEVKIYVSPRKPFCEYSVTDTYVEVTCTTMEVYPEINATLQRRERTLTMGDMLPGYPYCSLGTALSGFNGHNKADCTWRINMDKMLVHSTFYVEMYAYFDNETVVPKQASTSPDLTVSLNFPGVVLNDTNCPVGPRVLGQSILIGTSATCRCDLTSRAYPGVFARWFTKDNNQVGVENKLDGFSSLTVSYNPSDPNQAYECRPVTALVTNVSGIMYTPSFTSKNCRVTVEQGSSLQDIRCSIPANATSITWQILNGATTLNLSSCDIVNDCSTTTLPLIYNAYIARSGNFSVLLIFKARRNETQFICLTDRGQRIDTCILDVYVPPSKPTCNQQLTEAYVDYTCTTDNVYPQADVFFYRNQIELTQEHFAPNFTQCTRRYNSLGNFSQTCVWRIPMNRMLSISYIQIGMLGRSPNNITLSGRIFAYVYSDQMITSLSVPYVLVARETCPVGYGGNIRVGTNATCTCKLISVGIPPASFSWYDSNNKTVGVMDRRNLTSTLTLTYNGGSQQSYECRVTTPIQERIPTVTVVPVFTSAATTRTIVTGLQSLIIILGAVCARSIFHFQ